MTSAASEYLSNTWDRDKVLALVQFLPGVIQAPLKATGNVSLADSLVKAASIAEGYRTLTRFSGLIDILNDKKLESVAAIKDPVLRNISTLETATTVGFFFSENLAFLAKCGVISTNKTARWGGLAVWFWLWSLMCGNVRGVYQISQIYPNINSKGTDVASVRKQGEFKRIILSLLKNIMFTLLCVSIIPNEKPVLINSSNIICKTVNNAVAVCTPIALKTSPSMIAMYGTVASVIDIYLSVSK
eukprot:Tbor_TRINITY_DN5499_c2_g1::TRINITY_DN5499_c2_g1_i1::g.25421::m.25421/K13352/PEX11B; peroxin-11B